MSKTISIYLLFGKDLLAIGIIDEHQQSIKESTTNQTQKVSNEIQVRKGSNKTFKLNV